MLCVGWDFEGDLGGWAQVVECRVDVVHYGLEGAFAPEVGGAEDVGEVVVWVGGVECCDEVCECSSRACLA